ncbi:hypothetical protein TVAG_574110 [Trichomonas vaginalis G3]|uniref:Uncharacterized protein n=2 Tax=Trichomonas vaginalis (strain ATCC PRA-98 / G3) TaxID=412133 RepID=A2HGG6_TRIV3|nr:hypothetical protein TVAGG3_0362840 [Trichomonas vaginalis G3]EAX71502.1 hypothetical protein TVAG_574110 [Trichomonas vaginalis G3]KAI5532062.1 hypothetical protein TVAGG3_0362840 [Trichomonas vaginalis G3]|eukprot:XP_001284432.1 hypothetical protein [Trichomonas vaginalis G3]
MAQVAQLGKLPRQILLAFRVLPSDRKSPSIRQKKFFLPTGKVFPDNWKKFSRQLEKIFRTKEKIFPSDRKKFSSCPSVNHSNFRKLRTFWSNFRKSFSFRQKKFFLPTEKVFPSDRKSSSFRQEKFFLPTGHKRMTDVPLPECLPKPEEPTAPAPQQTY